MTFAAATLLLGTVLAACGVAGPASSASTTSSTPSASASSQTQLASPDASLTADESLPPFVCNLPVHRAANTPRAQITDLAVGAHDTYDRVVVTFAAGLPEYTLEKAVPPLTQDPSGGSVRVRGSSFLRLVLHGGTVQLPNGGKSYGNATSFTPQFSKLIDLQSAGDFEAVASWYIGMSGDACVRVFTLTAPSRLVIDLQH